MNLDSTLAVTKTCPKDGVHQNPPYRKRKRAGAPGAGTPAFGAGFDLLLVHGLRAGYDSGLDAGRAASV